MTKLISEAAVWLAISTCLFIAQSVWKLQAGLVYEKSRDPHTYHTEYIHNTYTSSWRASVHNLRSERTGMTGSFDLIWLCGYTRIPPQPPVNIRTNLIGPTSPAIDASFFRRYATVRHDTQRRFPTAVDITRPNERL